MKPSKISSVVGVVSVVALTLVVGGTRVGGGVLLSDNFNDNSLDATKWTIDTTAPSSSVVEQNQRIEITNRGNLRTFNQYDPEAQIDSETLLSGIRITGQWTLGPGSMADVEYLTIATRSAGVVNGGGFPLTGMLFGLLAFNGGYGEMRLTSSGDTALVGGNQIVGVSGILGSFAEGNTYNFTIVDRGTAGLSFTVANAATPTVTHTLTSALVSDNGANGYVLFNNRELTGFSHLSFLDNVTITTILAPEPSTVMLLALGVGLSYWRRRCR